jgi:hypothetical protein
MGFSQRLAEKKGNSSRSMHRVRKCTAEATSVSPIREWHLRILASNDEQIGRSFKMIEDPIKMSEASSRASEAVLAKKQRANIKAHGMFSIPSLASTDGSADGRPHGNTIHTAMP